MVSEYAHACGGGHVEPFKNNINPRTVDEIVALVPGGWDRDGFRVAALAGLDDLELKQRVHQVADALYAALPGTYPDRLAQLLERVPDGPEHADGLTESWAYWPLCTMVERHGLDHQELSLDAMERLTQHWSCEFAIRPYFAADPEGVLRRLDRWAGHRSVHVRRLVSEGSRPRLPWGMRLRHRIERPETMLPILERLRDDPEETVRRSVANHLNDIAKDHPDLVIDVGRAWLVDAPKTRQKLVKHAIRTQIKAGDPRAFALIGLEPFVGTVQVRRSPDRIAVGEAVEVCLVLHSDAERPQRVRLDLGVHHRRKNGTLSPKVFHWTERTVGPGQTLELTKSHKVREVSTRRLYAGEQGIDVRVNGVATARLAFELVDG